MFPQVAQRSPRGLRYRDADGHRRGLELSDPGARTTYSPSAQQEGATVIAGGSRSWARGLPLPMARCRRPTPWPRFETLPIYVSHRLIATSAQSGAVKVLAYCMPGDELSGKKVLDVAVRALKEFSRRFGSYPWRDFKLVEQPLTDGAAGLEHATVVSIGTLLYRTQSAMGPLAALATPQQKLGSHTATLGVPDKVLEVAVAHAVARQWWGGLVGSNAHLDPASDEPSPASTARSSTSRAAAAGTPPRTPSITSSGGRLPDDATGRRARWKHRSADRGIRQPAAVRGPHLREGSAILRGRTKATRGCHLRQSPRPLRPRATASARYRRALSWTRFAMSHPSRPMGIAALRERWFDADPRRRGCRSARLRQGARELNGDEDEPRRARR